MRQLRRGFKGRSSCITCRGRHVKCDGDRPACLRCAEDLRACEGYEAPKVQDSQLRMIHYFVPSPSKTLPSSPEGDVEMLRSLDFFTKFTAPELGGPFTVTMWAEIIRIAYSKTATQHALAALGALHEHVNKCGFTKDSEYPSCALRQYGKAMSKLVNLDLGSSVDNILLALVSSLVFAACENLRCHYASALRHINSGVRIFVEHSSVLDACNDEAVKACKKLLELSFLRSDSQTVEMAALATAPIVSRLTTDLPPIPQKFSSIEEAYIAFEMFFNQFIHLELHIGETFDESVSAEAQECHLDKSLELKAYFEAWSSAFDIADFEKTSAAVRILHLYKIGIPLFRSADLNEFETDWDRFAPEFKQLIVICETFLYATSNHPQFTMSLGIVNILYFVVHRCRDPTLRKRALNCLQNCTRREGMWDSAWAAQVGERIIHIEEAGADGPVTDAGQIPETARIIALEVSKSSDRSATVVYYKSVIETLNDGTLNLSYGAPIQGPIVVDMDW